MIGPSAVATAGHVVYNNNYGDDEDSRFAENAIITPAKANGTAPYGTAEAEGFVIFDAWSDNADSEYDVAIIELDRNIGDSVGYLGLRYQGSSYNGTEISLNGYPTSVNGSTTRIMYRSDGTISNSYTGKLRSKNTNFIGGMSGCPVYIDSSSTGYTAIAIGIGGATASDGTKFNQFVRITEFIYDELVAYRNIRV